MSCLHSTAVINLFLLLQLSGVHQNERMYDYFGNGLHTISVMKDLRPNSYHTGTLGQKLI